MFKWIVIVFLIFVVCELNDKVERLENSLKSVNDSIYTNPYSHDTTIIYKVEKQCLILLKTLCIIKEGYGVK